jgi:hypothetical protein
MKKSEVINFISVLAWFCLVFILGSESQAKTSEQAMNRIVEAFYKKFGGQELQRQRTFSVTDWRSELVQFVRAEKDNIPILGEPSLTTSTLNIVGLTKSGEILQFVDKTQIIELPNPLGWQGVSSGTWYKVKLLDSREGWIFAKPQDQSSPLATYFERKTLRQPQLQRQGNGAIYLIVIVAAVAIILLFKSFGKGKISPSYSSESSSYGDSDWDTPSSTEKREKANWPWRDSKVVIGQKNVYKEGFLGNTKVGHVEKSFGGEKHIYKEGFISSEKVGKVEKDFWGSSKSITDKEGRKVGDIKTTWTGSKIIVDEDGKKIGEYKDDKKDGQSEKSSGGGCFITTACVEAKGLPDNCPELNALRAFRDEYVRNLSNGEEIISDYYEVAPRIIVGINQEKNSRQVYLSLYDHLVLKSLNLIRKEKNYEALKNYLEIVRELKKRYM